MSEDNLMTIAIILSFGFGFWSSSLVDSIVLQYYILKGQLRNNRELKRKKDEIAAMRAQGNFHEWKELPFVNGTHLVCIKTGWCPSVKGFVDMERIKYFLNAEKTQKEYKEFRDARVRLIADRNDISVHETEKIVEEIFSMKKDFHLMKTAQLQQELQEKAADVAQQGNQV